MRSATHSTPNPYANAGSVSTNFTVYNRQVLFWRFGRNISAIKLAILLLAAALLLSALTVCGQSKDTRILVYAAASLKDVLTELGREYEAVNDVYVAFNWGGSVALANQLKRHAPGDVFIPAGARPMDELEETGVVAPGSRVTIASNSLVLAVSNGAEPSAQSLDQVLREASLVGLADPKLSPAGIYARESLESMGLWHEIHEKLVQGPNVRTALAYVESGATEVGIVYRTDAINSEGARIAHPIPPESHSPILYPAALLKDSRNPTEGAMFLAFLQKEPAMSRFQAYGFDVEVRP